ncbi:MAG: hypothetical protein IJD40_11395 [Lachnospiraceae bacterium]|nr:hypothetical protein [Lachnospiraceae bacterium]
MKKADYINKVMVPCNSVKPLELGKIGYTIFNNSGSCMLLGNIDGKKYFHTRESKTKNYDEQNRPIYNDLAFVADNKDDYLVVNKIAAYAFFNEEEFYSKISKMITLLGEGFTVDFELLAEFIKCFENDIELITEDKTAKNLFSKVFMKDNPNQISLIVPEATLEHFFKQSGSVLKKDVLESIDADEQKRFSEVSTFKFAVSDAVKDVNYNDDDRKEDDNPQEIITVVNSGSDKDKKVEELISKLADIEKNYNENKEKLSELEHTTDELKDKNNELGGKIKDLTEKINQFANMPKNDKSAFVKSTIIAALGVAVSVLLTLLIQGNVGG